MKPYFSEGDRVCIRGKFGQDKGTATVVRVLKTRVVLDNGQRYDHEGCKIGENGTRYLAQTISRAPEDA